MAVIREKRRFSTQGIGVVRESTGSEGSAKRIREFADSLISGSYKELASRAEVAGQEAAQAASAENIRTIDPETGKPEAFEMPAQFGGIAGRAYQNVIESRYVKETETHLQAYATKLFEETKLQEDGFKQFSNRLTQYAGELTDNAAPRFKNIVGGLASTLVASNEATYIKIKTQREAEENLLHLNTVSEEASGNITNVIASLDLSDTDSVEEVNAVVQASLDIQNEGLVANVHNSTSAQKVETQIIEALSNGVAQNMQRAMLASQTDKVPLKSDDLNIARAVLLSGDSDSIDKVDARLQPALRLAFNFKYKGFGKEEDRQIINARTQIIEGIKAPLTNMINNAAGIESDAKTARSEQEANNQRINNAGLQPAQETAINKFSELSSSGDMQGAIKAGMDRINVLEGMIANDTVGFAAARSSQAEIRRAMGAAIVNNMYSTGVQKLPNGDTVKRRLNASEGRELDAYLTSNGLDGKLPEGAKELYKQYKSIIKSDDNDYLNRKSGEFFEIVNRDASADAAHVKSVNTKANILAGTAANTTKNQGEMDSSILATADGSPVPSGYYLTSEAFEAFPFHAQVMMKTGIVGAEFKRTLTAVREGRQGITEEQMVMAVQMYDVLRNTKTQQLVTVNPLDRDGGLSSETNAFYDAVLSAVEIEGSGAIGRVVGEMQSAFSDTQSFSKRMTATVGDTTGFNIVGETFPDLGYTATEELASVVPYFVAAGGSKDNVVRLLNNHYKRNYYPTEGYVIDPASYTPPEGPFDEDNVHVSKHAMAKHFPDTMQRIRLFENLSRHIKGLGNDARFFRQEKTFREGAGFITDTIGGYTEETLDKLYSIGDEFDTALYLTHQGKIGAEDVYTVMQFDKSGNLIPYLAKSNELGDRNLLSYTVSELRKFAPEQPAPFESPVQELKAFIGLPQDI